jgi:hypothetical protein
MAKDQRSADVDELRRSLGRSLAILRKAVSDGSRQLPPGWSEPPAYWEYWMKVRYHHPLFAWFARGLIHVYLMITNRSFDVERPYLPPQSITLLRSNTGMCCGNKGPVTFVPQTRCSLFSKRSGWICPDSPRMNFGENMGPRNLRRRCQSGSPLPRSLPSAVHGVPVVVSRKGSCVAIRNATSQLSWPCSSWCARRP